MEYYVDNTISNSGDGSSWSQAWNSFSAIDWSAVHPNDTIYISGGSNSQTYNETLSVGASGSAAGTINITQGVDPGHDGKVIIDGGEARGLGVEINSHDYVNVSHLNVQNITDAGFSVKNAHAGVVLEHNAVYSGDPGGGNARGYDVRDSAGHDAVVVQDNSYRTPASTQAQTDGIWSSNNDGVVFHGNDIVIANTDSTGHSDGIQSHQDKNITVTGNYFAHPDGGLNNHGMWVTNIANGGTVDIHDNLVSMPKGDEIGISVWNQDAGWGGKADIWNNTVDGGYYSFQLRATPDSELHNNIAQPSDGQVGIFVADGSPAAGNIDHNLVWAPSATVAYVDSASQSWEQWQGHGYDAHGVNADPQFTDAAGNDHALAAGSPAIDAGQAYAESTTDFQGAARPQGAGYDIGAFEMPADAAHAGTDYLFA